MAAKSFSPGGRVRLAIALASISILFGAHLLAAGQTTPPGLPKTLPKLPKALPKPPEVKPPTGPAQPTPGLPHPAIAPQPSANGGVAPHFPAPSQPTVGKVGLPTTRTAPNGATVFTRANGRVSNIHDPSRNMDIHHGLDGSRRVEVRRPDGSRLVAERGRPGYVETPYRYRNGDFARRSIYDHGVRYDRYYRRYDYGGVYLNVYAPAYYYSPDFYGWDYYPWAGPVAYGWGWDGAPWYGYYGAYFTPYPTYPSAALWLTDYMIAADLQAAYAAQAADAGQVADATQSPYAAQLAAVANAAQAAQGAYAGQVANAMQAAQAALAAYAAQVSAQGAYPTQQQPRSVAVTPPLTPDVKQAIADEVKNQLELENVEAAQAMGDLDVDPGSSGIGRMIDDVRTGHPHIFVVGDSLDLVDASSGQECHVSDGDALQMQAAPPQDATSANLVVKATKGSNECVLGSTVVVNVVDLQEMQNHMRENIDAGLKQLQTNQGKGGLPPAPPSAKTPPTQPQYAALAPPPHPSDAADVQALSKQADQVEAAAQGTPTASLSTPR